VIEDRILKTNAYHASNCFADLKSES